MPSSIPHPERALDVKLYRAQPTFMKGIRLCKTASLWVLLQTCINLHFEVGNVSNSGHNGFVKPIDFHPRALEFIRAQATSIRRQIGEALRDLQKGISPGMPLSRPISVIAPGVRELRGRDETITVRVFYAAAKTGTIVVFHGFQKKSQKTPIREIDLARRRLREVLNAKIEV